MKCSKEEILQYVAEEDVKFIRLAFCDVYGRQKNISIMPGELARAFEHGVPFDASAITGFGDEAKSDLFLHPEPDTLTPLPWRPEHGRVVRMFCHITEPDGSPFVCDTRSLLRRASEDAEREGVRFLFGAEQEFYLFALDEQGEPTREPYDRAGYMDIAPEDRGENIRREVCLTLEQMGIVPESSHHEEGPGQNEIDFRYSDPLSAADHAITFQTVVRTVARRNGLWADFSPRPIPDKPGNGFHINISTDPVGDEAFRGMIAGILERTRELTVFLNPLEESYSRLGKRKAPAYVSWSRENRSPLIRIPATPAGMQRAELRSPDPAANPYLAFFLLIHAAMEGIREKKELPAPADFNLFRADSETLAQYRRLPANLAEARTIAAESRFVREHVPEEILRIYCCGE